MIPAARREMLQAARWYDRKSNGLGDRFLDEVRSAIVAFNSPPVAAVAMGPDYSRKLLDVFPYALIFRVDGQTVTIVAVAHLKRRPGYWHKRLSAQTGEPDDD